MPEEGEFARARAKARVDALVQRDRAVRTVAEQAVDAKDFHSLLSMLGLDDGRDSPTLRRGLAGYVRAVARALEVPTEATNFEISDTVTAYLGLSVRWPIRPSRDLMLVWTDRHGWAVAVETIPTERPIVIDYLGGDDLVPVPRAVARFLSGVLTGQRLIAAQPTFPVDYSRGDLAERLNRYASGPGFH
jgi:uncharacterized protein DUF6292